MKKVLKIFTIIMIVIILINTFCINTSFAINPNDYKPNEFTEVGDAVNIPKRIIGAFQAIGSIVAVLALVVIGIKYMMGSAEEKAEFKKTATSYIIGAILVFAISNISKILYDFGTSLNN